MEPDLFSLLQQTTSILQQAADYYVRADTKRAIKARELVDGSTPGHRRFHAAIFERFSTLQASLEVSNRAPDLADVQASVRQTLNTFEALVRAKDNVQSFKTDLGSTYEGLQSLQALYEADRVSKRRPKPLGFRRYLYCPPLNLRARLKDDITSCCNVLAQGPEDYGGADILDELETIREWTVPPSMVDHAARVRDVLDRHWTCSCGDDHREVKLAFTVSSRRFADKDILGCYRLHWPTGGLSKQKSRVPLLHLIKATAEGTAVVSTGELKPKKNVRFTADDESEVSAAQRQNSDLQAFSSLCDAVNSNDGECIVRANEDTVGSLALSSDARLGNDPPMRSLRSLLVPGKPWTQAEVAPKQRIIMAVALAYAYLHLSDTAWWPKRETLPDFWFMIDSHQQGLKAGLPFLAFRLGLSGTYNSKTEGFINPSRPSLPALGKLLLEIWKGAPLTWGHELDTAVAECELDYGGTYWLCAVNACLGKETTFREEQTFHDSSRMRSIFVLKVIKSLQWLLEKCFKGSGDLLFPAPESSMQRLNHYRSEAMPKPLAMPMRPSKTAEVLNDACLHDGSGGWEPCENKNKEAAKVWLKQLQSEVHPFVEPQAQPVKVAIIDTGVFLHRRTRMLYEGRVKEVRSFVKEADGERGVLCPEGEDMDGHGTHATSVFLDTDPFSEVYVAKVFHRRDQKQGASLQNELQLGVARAITHAIRIWKVQVISLSFGFEYQVDVIRKAIQDAGQSNALVLAAASNNGGNKPLSWPARQEAVFNIYATNGYGNSYERNPTQRRRDDNFAVLGSCVKGWWNSGEKVIRSGTSTATPIAAGLASLTIHFLRQHQARYAERQDRPREDLNGICERISTYAGMRRIFMRMVDHDTGDRDGYCYLEPWLLFDQNVSKDTICENIIAELRLV